jgi:hypothetical protein
VLILMGSVCWGCAWAAAGTGDEIDSKRLDALDNVEDVFAEDVVEDTDDATDLEEETLSA